MSAKKIIVGMIAYIVLMATLMILILSLTSCKSIARYNYPVIHTPLETNGVPIHVRTGLYYNAETVFGPALEEP